MAAAKSPSGVRPSIHSVAAYAGVSIATVSKVMQGDKTVRPENVKSVQNAIEALGYRINPLAADLRRGRRNLVGVIVPAYDDPYYASLIGALEKQAEAHGFALTTASSRDSEKRELELVGRMEDWRVSGVILAPVKNESSPGARMLRENAMAAVFVDRVLDTSQTDTIAIDYPAAIRAVAAHVISLGHKRIVIPIEELKSQTQMRLASYLTEQLISGAADAKVQILPSPPRLERMAESMAEVFGADDRPTLVLSFCELAIMSILNIAKRVEWRVPDDLSLFSFKSATWMQAMEPVIGCVELPVDGLAAVVMDNLFLRIEKRAVLGTDRFVTCKFSFGQSMATPRESKRLDRVEAASDIRLRP